MVDKARSNPFTIFIRKIGYSVGLEHTIERLSDFACLYASRDTINYADISRLLHDPKPAGWGLDKNNEHVLDVMRSLDVVSVRNGDVGVLEAGDALGILHKLQGEHDFKSSLQFVFAQSLLRADGDIFLNALTARFDPSEFRDRMQRLIEFKRAILESLFQSSQQRASIYQAINIEVQENNRGSRGRIGGLTAHREDSPFAQRGSLLAATSRPEPRVSDAYLTKALPRRKAWAISLGLSSPDGNLTALGDRFVQHLVDAGFGGPSCMAMWPLAYETKTTTFAGLQFPEAATILDSWAYFSLVRRALGAVVGERPIDDQVQSEGVSQLQTILKTYRSLNLSKTIVRTELPARVAYLVVLASTDQQNRALPVPDIVEFEQKRPSPRLMARSSRLAEFALSD